MNTKDQNLGLWYYKTFFYTFERECDSFLNATWENTIVQKVELSYSQKMTTLYPGLVCGIGYEHELKIDKNLSWDFLLTLLQDSHIFPDRLSRASCGRHLETRLLYNMQVIRRVSILRELTGENWKMIFLRALPMKNKNLNAPIKQMCSLMLLLLAHTREMIRRYYQMIV